MTKILVTDDSAFMRSILRSQLAELGYTDVVEAALGKQALDEFDEKKPDMVLLDIILPDMNGDEVLDKIMEKDPDAKVIMVTAVGQKPIIDKCMKSGAKSYVAKPFDKERIKAVLEKWA